ncbi:hypothetical protein VNI00_011494 [Paramarasmius palmivorus]|uniref:Protein kinase domain-containing protein n=1 Tax=Paramarasmius palmivorus TaxID=297713 RepID=A0AAW0CDE0_9AGAR
MSTLVSGETEGVFTKKDLRRIFISSYAIDLLCSMDVALVPRVVDLLQMEASSNGNLEYRKFCLRALRALVKKHNILPSSLFLDNITREGGHALLGGGFSDIWKGFYGDQPVCLKVLRIHLEADERKRAKTLAIYEIASGMAYLHSLRPIIVHGDIKGRNVLVDDHHSCRLADFGLATMIETQRLDSTTSGSPKGTVRWMAPELLYSPDDLAVDANHPPRDVYAFACTVYEIMSGKHPIVRVGALE